MDNAFQKQNLGYLEIAFEPTPLTGLNGRDEIPASARQRHFDIAANITSHHHESGISLESLTPDSARTRVRVLISAHDKTEAPPNISITVAGVRHDEGRKTLKLSC